MRGTLKLSSDRSIQ